MGVGVLVCTHDGDFVLCRLTILRLVMELFLDTGLCQHMSKD